MPRLSTALFLTTASLCLWLLPRLSVVPSWAASKRECTRECGAAISACESQAGRFAPGFGTKFRRTCKKTVLKACRKRGVEVCEDGAALLCVQPPASTLDRTPAIAATSKRECKRECPAAIAACADEIGQFAPGFATKFRRICKKVMLKACRKSGLGVCEDGAALVCAQPPAPATTTSVSPTTTTLPLSPTITTTTTTNTTTTTLASGCFVDVGDGTITDTCTGLQWEKKDEAGGSHDVSNTYSWAGRCRLNSSVRCQPDAAAAATCAAQTNGALGCGVCGAGEGMCNPAPFGGITTIWDWVTQLNEQGFAGHSDWRLATVNRDGDLAGLETIMPGWPTPSCPGLPSPCIDPIFGPTNASSYWSATTYQPVPDSARGVHFFGAGTQFIGGKFDAAHVRAVRGTAIRFVDNGDGTITDLHTSLMWEKKSRDGTIHDVGNEHTWSSILAGPADGTAYTVFLAGLNAGAGFAGYNDWRLPEVDRNGEAMELDSLLDPDEAAPRISAEFKTPCTPDCTVIECSCTAAVYYLSATAPGEDSPFAAFGVNFGVINVFPDVAEVRKDLDGFVRAVRGGP
jgi:hypothetical protein